MNKKYISKENEMIHFSYYNSIEDKSISYSIYSDATILPCKKNKGGVCDRAGKFIEKSLSISDWQIRGGYYPFAESEVEYIDEDVVFLGFHVNHWGHFLVEETSKFWVIDENKNYKYVLLGVDNFGISQNCLRILNLLGIRNEDIILLNKITRFRSVLVPDSSIDTNQGYTKEFIQVFNRLIKKVQLNDYCIADKVYLSRRKFSDADQKEFGEDKIEVLFKKAGYKIMYPEMLSVDEQIAIFQKAKRIACINGTIPLMVLFSNDELELVVLNKTSLLHKNLLQASHARGIKPIYVDAFYEPIKHHPRYLGEGPFWIEVNENMKSFFFEYENLNINIENRKLQNMIKYYYMYFKTRILRNGYLYVRHRIGLFLKNER